MEYLYSATTGGFYRLDIHGDDIPPDIVGVNAQRYSELFTGQSQGMEITADATGHPCLSKPQSLSIERLAPAERQWRDELLLLTDGFVARHRDEIEEHAPLTLSEAQYTALQSYRRQLRGWPETPEFPQVEHRPVAPDWFGQTKP